MSEDKQEKGKSIQKYSKQSPLPPKNIGKNNDNKKPSNDNKK